KRVFDLLVASLTFLITLPLFILIAVAIKLDSPGPVIFKQKRAGENGKVFEMYKFRSMQADAEGKFSDVVKHDDEGNLIHKTPDDPRITRVGHFIRRTSLDELPQIINVLKGDMSLVGPRPEIPILVSNYNLWQQKRFAVPQGITGWWQINGRSDKLLHLHTEDDLYYIQNYSLWLDIQILFKTIPVVMQRKGAF
ncbi:MAG: sugar transferase, partial [Anaerolineales bacterium]|nr:sugar transferase [Anaerolineales bacterium]